MAFFSLSLSATPNGLFSWENWETKFLHTQSKDVFLLAACPAPEKMRIFFLDVFQFFFRLLKARNLVNQYSRIACKLIRESLRLFSWWLVFSMGSRIEMEEFSVWRIQMTLCCGNCCRLECSWCEYVGGGGLVEYMTNPKFTSESKMSEANCTSNETHL